MNTDQLAWALDLAARYLSGLQNKIEKIKQEIVDLEHGIREHNQSHVNAICQSNRLYQELDLLYKKKNKLHHDLFYDDLTKSATEFQNVACTLRRLSETERHAMMNIPVRLAVMSQLPHAFDEEKDEWPQADSGFCEMNL